MSDPKPTDRAKPGDAPGSGRRSRSESVDRIFRLNWKAAVGLVAAVVLAGIVYAVAVRVNDRNVRGQVLRAADAFVKEGKVDLALRNLGRFLDTHPDDLEALEKQAQISAESARTTEEALNAAKINERLLRRDPNGPGRQETRRRLVALYVQTADVLRSGANSRLKSEALVFDLKYQAARTIAEELVYRFDVDKDGLKFNTFEENQGIRPDDHRLLAMALEGLAVPGNPKALDDSIGEYEKALRGDPGDSKTAERLALLYLDRRKDPGRGEALLDDLVAVRPEDHQVRLIRHRFFLKTRRPDRAAAELEQAIRLAPDDLGVRLTAAGDALRRGDGKAARGHLGAIAGASRGDLRVKVMQGMIDFNEERPDDAILGWRQGLMTVDGTDAELTWWLAHAFLRMGNVAAARPLVLQYRRLAGDESQPLYQLLQAQLEEQTGRPTRAIALLDKAKDRLADFYLGMAYLVLGRCYEANSDRERALTAYRRAGQVEPTLTESRIGSARILGANTADAVLELERGLALDPGEPSLQVALVTALLRQEAARPMAERSWKEFDEAMARASGSMGVNGPLLLLQADRLSLGNDLAGAIALLEQGVAAVPGNSTIWITLAEALDRAGRPTEASEALQRASRPGAVGDRARIRVARAGFLLGRGRGREARDLLDRATRELPASDRPEIWEALGRLDVSRGDVEGARAAFFEWGRLLPEDPRPRLALLDLAETIGDDAALRATVEALRAIEGPQDVAWRLSRAQELLRERHDVDASPGGRDSALDEADRLVRGVLEDAPELPAAHVLKGRVLERLNNPIEARNAYLKAHQGGVRSALPRLVDLLTRLGRFDELADLKATTPAAQLDRLSAAASLRAGNTEEAGRFVDRSVRDGGSGPDSSGWQSRMSETLGHREQSESILRAAAERRPTEIRGWSELIRALARHGKSAEVASTIERARSLVGVEERDLAEARFRWAAGDREAADRAFRAAIGRKPGDVGVLMTAAEYYKESGRVDEAASGLKAALKLEPKNRVALQELAVLLANRPETWGEAERLIGAGDSPGDEPADRLARAVVLVRAEDPARKAQALEVLGTLVEDLPANHPVATRGRALLARLLLASGQADRAREVAAILANSGDDPPALGLYIECLLQTRRFPEAIRQVDRLGSIDPGDADSAGFRVRWVRESARPGEAARALEKAVRDRAGRPESERFARAAFASITALDPHALDEAESVGRIVAGFRPSASWMMGRVLARRGELAEALDYCREAYGSEVDDDRRGAAEIAMEVATRPEVDPGLLARASAITDATLASDPADFTILTVGAMVRHVQARFEDEARLYRAALAVRPGHPLASNNLAWALSEGLGRPSEALPLIDEVIRRQGRLGWILDTRGVVLTRLGRLDEALEDLKEAGGDRPSPVVLFHLALASRKANHDQEFRRYRDQARRAGINPNMVDPSEQGDLASVMAP